MHRLTISLHVKMTSLQIFVCLNLRNSVDFVFFRMQQDNFLIQCDNNVRILIHVIGQMQ